ncbi:MAG: calcium-binding protein [Bdellovibrionota bacterium]
MNRSALLFASAALLAALLFAIFFAFQGGNSVPAGSSTGSPSGAQSSLPIEQSNERAEKDSSGKPGGIPSAPSAETAVGGGDNTKSRAEMEKERLFGSTPKGAHPLWGVKEPPKPTAERRAKDKKAYEERRQKRDAPKTDFPQVAGTQDHDTLEGSEKPDTIQGGNGDDYLRGAEGDDWMDGEQGDDTLEGGPGDDTLEGADGDNVLEGGPGDDSLYAAHGDDILQGGPGADLLNGGGGPDTFVYEDGDQQGGPDRIEEFNPAEGDILLLADLLLKGGYQGNGSPESLSGFVRIQENMLQVDPDGGGNNFVDLADLGGPFDLGQLVEGGYLRAVP